MKRGPQKKKYLAKIGSILINMDTVGFRKAMGLQDAIYTDEFVTLCIHKARLQSDVMTRAQKFFSQKWVDDWRLRYPEEAGSVFPDFKEDDDHGADDPPDL